MSSAAVQSIQQPTQQYPHSSPAPSTLTPDQSPDLSLSPASSRRQQHKFALVNGAPPNTPHSLAENFSPPMSASLESPTTYQGTPTSVQSTGSTDAAGSARSGQDMDQSRVSTQSSHPFDTPKIPGSVLVDRSREHAGSTPGATASATKKKKDQRNFSEPQKTRAGRRSREPAKSRSAAALNQPITNSPLSREIPPSKPSTSHHDAPETQGLGLTDPSGARETEPRSQPVQRSRQEYLRNAPKRETKFGNYILGQTIGEGEFGKVKMGWKKEGGVQVAIKLIRREALGNDINRRLPKIYREIKILQGLNHDNIVRLHEMVETDKYIGIILEYASGGELFDHILNQRYLKDAAARPLFAQLVSGVGYLHQRGIVHRDLKLENLLLDRNRNIIITDFGFANTFDPKDHLSEEVERNLGNKDFVRKLDLETPSQTTGYRRGDLMQTSCGSPCYAAPELVVSDSLYTSRKVDVWSCGVILYAMLAGYLPFDDDPANPEGDNINLLYKYIVTTPLTFPEYVTPHARDILRRILVPNPRKRADLFEVARHSWLNDYAHALAFITSDSADGVDAPPAPPTTFEEPISVAPVLTRSASVRETVKPPKMPSGGLNHPGAAIAEERAPTPRDTKRRTVQLEYVAPQSATARVTQEHVARSPGTPSSPQAASPKTRARARTSSNAASAVVVHAQDSPGSVKTSTQEAKPVSETKSPRLPRAASDSSAFVLTKTLQPSPEQQRPTTQGSVGGSNRLPSRGNSYARPVAATVAPTNAQAQLSQPTYEPSGAQPDAPGRNGATGRPLDTHVPDYEEHKRPSTGQEPGRQKRNSAILEFTSRILGRSNSTRRESNRQQHAPEGPSGRPDRAKNRMFPPVSMANNRSAAESRPRTAEGASRKSSESRRSSFGISRRESTENKRSSKRFSFLATGFSKMNLGGGSSEETSTENKRSSWQQQAPRSRHDSKSFLGMAFGQGFESPDTSGTTAARIDSSVDDRKRQQLRMQQGEMQRGATAPDLLSYPSAPIQSARPIPAAEQPPTYRPRQQQQQQPQQSPAPESANAIPPQSPIWPTRRPVGGSPRTYSPSETQDKFAPDPASAGGQASQKFPMQQATTSPMLTAMPNKGDFANLQKPSRKFGDAYNVGGNAGSSNKARTVMDWFRRRARERNN